MTAAAPIVGIEGLVGREPSRASLAVGKTGDRGAPVERDRFHVLLPNAQLRELGGRTNTVRDPHPSFAPFNGAGPERRAVIQARLAHARISECFEFRRQAQVLPSIVHPKKAPACQGDGVRARRWNPERSDYVEIQCPGERCPHTQKPDPSKPSACKPFMRFLARFDFPRDTTGRGLPNLPFKFTSGSWNTVKNFVGFFESFKANCRNLGVDPDSIPLFGLPVSLQLQERTDPGQQRRFPVVSIVVAGDGDLIGWIVGQMERVRSLGLPGHPVAAIEDLGGDFDHDLHSGPVEARVPGA